MSKKIIGITVGTQLPKPNFKQTDPTKGDYIRNKPDFDGLKSRVTDVEEALNSINIEVDTTLSIEGKAADAKAVGDALANIYAALTINYDNLEFDTTEIVFNSTTSAILGQAMLGQLVLA